jgi:2-methylcitrate dehydratase PrpD
MDAALSFANLVVNTNYEDIPKQDVEVTKRNILDSLGALIGGSTTDTAATEMVKLIQETGGTQESRIISHGGKAPVWLAAFANGAMAHVLDYEDTHDDAVVHVGGCTLPAALVAADALGGVTGKEFITAYALGGEMLIRMGLARIHPTAWYLYMLPSVMGTFSSAAAASRLFKLTEEQVISAFGLALQQAAGSFEVNFDPGSHVRAIRDAFSAKGGVLAVLMAQRGIKGARNSLEGKAGLFNLHLKGEYNPASLTEELGTKWHMAELSFKPWPCSRWTHAHLDAELRALKEHDIAPEDIEEITGVTGISGLMMFDPIEKKRTPETSIDAKASLPFTLAVGALQRQLLIGDFLPERLKDPAVLEMARRVNYRFEEDPDVIALRPGIVEIKTKQGKVYTERVDYPYGHPHNPITTDDLIAKFKDCTSYSAKPLSEENLTRVIDMLLNLEKVKDVRELIDLVS